MAILSELKKPEEYSIALSNIDNDRLPLIFRNERLRVTALFNNKQTAIVIESHNDRLCVGQTINITLPFDFIEEPYWKSLKKGEYVTIWNEMDD